MEAAVDERMAGMENEGYEGSLPRSNDCEGIFWRTPLLTEQEVIALRQRDDSVQVLDVEQER